MLNIEKYKDELLKEHKNISRSGMDDGDFYLTLYNAASKHNKEVHDNWSLKSLLDWFLSEYKTPILDEEEREYLSNVIKPFRDSITTIAKFPCEMDRKEYCEYIQIRFNTTLRSMAFPYFKKGAMYKGMKLYKEYTLEELGL